MTRTITALFDSRADAEVARQRVEDAGIDVADLHIADKSSDGHTDAGYSTHENRGFWASLKGAFLPDEDRHAYEEGVRRGGYLLSGEIAEDHAEEAIAILDNAGTVDIDRRAGDWRTKGWDYPARTDASRNSDRVVDGADSVIPIVEEQVRVGTRAVDRGGVRVRSYVVETPVREQVSLRDETVSVERRAVDQPLAADGDAFRERTIEMTETAEEAVIDKTARVVEEVVVRKDVSDRTETVNDTVRRTEVEVEDLGRSDHATNGLASARGSAPSVGDRVAGFAREATGKVTGDEALERRGEAQQGKLRS